MTAFASDRLAGSQPAATERANSRARLAVRLWLALLIGLTLAIVLVGGATRLTGSGLSITEWQPVVGAVPPLSHAAWLEAFDQYRATSQYEILNRGMSLAEFQFIYWWEWGHRQLGRFIGLVYVAGLIGFAATRAVGRRAWLALFGLGLLLGLQGLVGWIMVASGLQPGMVAVAPVKLTLHLTFACLFFAALVAAFVRFGGARRMPAPAALTAGAWALAALIVVQIALGGLVAGHKAGLAYNTWPLMDGRFVPEGWLMLEPVWRNFVENVTTVQFVHRMGAYAIALAAAGYAWWAWRAGSALRRRTALILTLVAIQVVLGILTLIHHVPLGLALAHQGAALLLLGAAVWNAASLQGVSRRRGPAPAA
ncbi:MAG TPA: COX15/CtaA family protein [Afifellaceae bacterium]|nr:COX15/CtaA family protein [Afifellaceae bacterium]